jgi:hypothetical protein
MNKHVPFDKLSKREKKIENARRRRDWGSMNPVTRRPANPRAYNRNRKKQIVQKEDAC